MSLELVPVTTGPVAEKFVQPLPWQCSTWYPVTPTLSVEAVQLRLIWLPDAVVALSCVGALGGCVSGVGAIAVFMSVWISAWLRARL